MLEVSWLVCVCVIVCRVFDCAIVRLLCLIVSLRVCRRVAVVVLCAGGAGAVGGGLRILHNTNDTRGPGGAGFRAQVSALGRMSVCYWHAQLFR